MADKFYLGIDYGIKKTGIAIAQRVTKESRPFKIIYKDRDYIILMYVY